MLDGETVTDRPELSVSVDNPEAYIAGDRRRALAAGVDLPDRIVGAALFADISGFTPLTEGLVTELGPQRGAETVGAILDGLFAALLGELHRHGGVVIYFSGDAVTCWLDGDDGTRAVSCGLAMQEVMTAAGRPVLPSGRVVPLALKVAVAAGPARRFVVGDPAVQLVDVLAGALVDDLAATEQQAGSGEVLVAPATRVALGDRGVWGETRPDGSTVVARLADPPALPEPPPPAPPLADDVVRPWLLPAVYERMRAGRGEFLTEMRSAIPLFLRFGGIDYDDDPEARTKLNDFVVRAQRVIDGYGGNALQLTLGDKGAYLYAVFGSPIAHEDDAARACAAALDLLRLDSDTAATGLQIGLAHGRLRSGTYGHRERRTFCCLGDAVNLAARLMTNAPAGGVRVADAVREAAGDRFVWAELPPLTVKGKADPLTVFALEGLAETGRAPHRRHALELIGRTAELAAISAAVDAALAGKGRVVALSGEAGLGKSRLQAEAARLLTAHGVPTYEGEAQAFGATTSYFAWRPVWAGLLGLSGLPADATTADQLAHLQRRLGEVDPALVDRAPLLGPLLGLELPDNELTGSLDAKLRKASLEQLLVRCLTHAARRPVAVMLEDTHWLDPLSQDLLVMLGRVVAGLPVVLILAHRDDGSAWFDAVCGWEHAVHLPLDVLPDDAAALMVAAKVRQLYGLADAPPALVQLVRERSEGSPFHIEELLNFIRSRGIDPTDTSALTELEVPESLHSLVLSRLDQLAEPARRTVKVASVVGRLFHTPTLLGSYPSLGTSDQVADHLATVRAAQLVLLESAAEQAHLFRHSVIRDVAYDSIPFALRETLHERVGSYLEHEPASGDAGRQQLDLLAYHFSRSANPAKRLEYLLRAGEAAEAVYNNAVAADYLRRALPLLPEEDRGPTARRLGHVLEILGEWPEAERVYATALDEALAQGDLTGAGAARLSLAEVSRKAGRYDQAEQLLAQSEADFVATRDEGGRGRALHLAGTLAAQQGRYDDARGRYLESLDIRRGLGDVAQEAALLGNLGILAEYEGDYAEARRLNGAALELRQGLGDRWAIGASLLNLGMAAQMQGDLDAARESFTQAMQIMTQIGDPWMTAVAHNNLGTTLRRLGELPGAAGHLAESLRAYQTFEDRWALGILFEDVAALAVAGGGGRDRALLLVGAADAVRSDLGSPRPPAVQAELVALLGEHDASPGRALTLAAAVELALETCEQIT